LQLCIFPRCIFSAQDAVYCANMIQQLHLMKTNNFSTLLCFDRLFTDISTMVTSLTENEASRYGRFLNQMLTMVKNWHSSKSVYEKNCGDSPGFITLLRASSNEQNRAANHLDFENFRHVCHKWQYKITKALVCLLESGEFVQIRNALVVLTKILPCFPAVTGLGQALEKRVEKIGQEEKDKRPDIFALAMGYLGQLRAKKSQMIPEIQYHNKKKPVTTSKQPEVSKKDKDDKKTSSKSESKRSYSKTKEDKTGSKRKSEPDSKSDKKKDRSESKDRNSSKTKDSVSKSRSSNGGESKKSKMPPPNGSGEPTDSKRRKVESTTNGARETSKSKESKDHRSKSQGGERKRTSEGRKAPSREKSEDKLKKESKKRQHSLDRHQQHSKSRSGSNSRKGEYHSRDKSSKSSVGHHRY